MPIMSAQEAREKTMQYEMDTYVLKSIENVKIEEILSKFIAHQGKNMSFNLELPSYNNISAEEMAAAIGLNIKHIPVLIQSFTQESIGILENLEAAIEAKNYENISSHAHSIKGSSGNLKFKEIYELAKDMELCAKEGREDYPYADACKSLKKAIQSISL